MTDLLDPTDDVETDTASTTRRRRILALAVVVLLALIGGLWWFVIRDDAPARLDIEDATSALETEPGDDPVVSTHPTVASGTWTVDPTLGAEAGGATAGYRVAEELSTIGVTEAVGRTSQVEGTVVIDGSRVTDATVVVDMASVETDDDRRDRRYRSALRVDEFPAATFVLTEAIDLGSTPANGDTISVAAVGEMTITGTTNPVTVELNASIIDDVLVIVGSLNVVFDDYGVDEPSAAIVVSLADNADIEFQVFLTRTAP